MARDMDGEGVVAGLDRFLPAQRDDYATALGEIRAGIKRSHWIWYIFPQLAALGRSATARHYGIADLAEARAYLASPVLGERLERVTLAMLDWAGKRTPQTILGDIDAMKFASSMTLFEAAGGALFGRALDELCAGRRDQATLALID
jgi:uncharacterized protein (DUF1810 family)